MAGKLDGKRVAIVATDGFEQSELLKPLEALRDAGAKVDVVSLKTGEIQGIEHDQKGEKVKVDLSFGNADAADYDALVLPGGVANPDTLRIHADAVGFIDSFVKSGKPISAICHGPWTLIETNLLPGRRVTSWPSLRTDLYNAGAIWVDEKVVRDGNLVTSRKPDDLPDFCRATIAMIVEADGAAMAAE